MHGDPAVMFCCLKLRSKMGVDGVHSCGGRAMCIVIAIELVFVRGKRQDIQQVAHSECCPIEVIRNICNSILSSPPKFHYHF
jgi:hypothetical protein